MRRLAYERASARSKHFSMGNLTLEKLLAFGIKPFFFIKTKGMRLGMQKNPFDSACRSLIDEAAENNAPESPTTEFWQHGHAPNTTVWQQASGGDRMVSGAHYGMPADPVLFIPFLFLGYSLLLYEDLLAHWAGHVF
jgi:hypothetical protein